MKRLWLLIIVLISFYGIAQNDADVILKVEGEPITKSDFISVFTKNLDLVKDESQKDPENYLELFIDYKLKVKEAYARGLDKRASYKAEFARYKEQLISNYLMEPSVSDKLVREAYERLQKEVNADHILVKTHGRDTLQAYGTIQEIWKRIAGEGFDRVKQEVKNGKTILGEELGYFSVFNMVYPFETVAFNTSVGEVSAPFRTRFGYHILRVNDVKPNPGTARVAHIYLKDRGANDSILKVKLKNIREGLNNGIDFSDLAKQYSEDSKTAFSGGLLPEIEPGKTGSPEFEKIVFSLKEEEVSQAFKTRHGWHFVKLIEKHPIGSFTEEKTGLIEQIKKDDRSKLIDEAFINSLKEKYKIVENGNTGKWIFDKLMSGSSYKEENNLAANVLFTIETESKTIDDFVSYLGFPDGVRFREIQLQKLYNTFLSNCLIAYHKAHLEDTNKVYAAVLREYREGLLIFDLLQEEVWSKGQQDSIGIVRYYEANKQHYKSPKPPENWKEIRSIVGVDYQKYMERKWLEELRKKYRVERHTRNLKKMIKELNRKY